MPMPSVDVVWKAHCRDSKVRYRLLSYLHRLASLNDDYRRRDGRPWRSLIGASPSAQPRPDIEVFDDLVSGLILISSTVALHPERLVARAEEAGLPVSAPDGDSAHRITLDEIRLRGLDFKLFDPRARCPDDDRMSFVFMDCPAHHFLDGRLVALVEKDGVVHLDAPRLRLGSYLEDWTDCLFSWIRFFMVGDFWWQRREELQGYADYREVFKQLQTRRGHAEAEDATFDAVLSTLSQHAEYSIDEVDSLAKAGKA